MAFKNWDYFVSAEEKTDIKCRVCNKKLTGVYKNGQTEMYGEKVDHWEYKCSESSKAWHDRVYALKQEAERTVSNRLRQIILEEAEEERQNGICL